MSERAELEAWLLPLLDSLHPTQVRRLTRRLAVKLRQSQGARIAAQMNPDGTAYVPRRKPRHGQRAAGAQKAERERVTAMFSKLRTASHLKVRSDAHEAGVAIEGRSARIARVHQFGLLDRTRADGPEVRYPIRALLGLTSDDLVAIEEQLLAHLTK